jgi:hypothetical protein
MSKFWLVLMIVSMIMSTSVVVGKSNFIPNESASVSNGGGGGDDDGVVTSNFTHIGNNSERIVHHQKENKIKDNDDLTSLIKVNSNLKGGLSQVSLIIICVALVAASVLIVVILSSLFVMRRRFSTWRLNGTSSNSKEGQVEEEETKSDGDDTQHPNSSEDKVDGTVTKTTKCITCDINEKIEQVNEEKKDNDTEKTTTIDVKSSENIEQGQGQGSPSSGSPLIEEDDVNKKETTTTTTDKPQQDNVTDKIEKKPSSTSLIASVLNDLSESVSAKLSNAKQTSSSTKLENEKEDESEKEKENNEEENKN